MMCIMTSGMETMSTVEWRTETRKATIRQNVRCKCGARRSRLVAQTVTTTYRSDQFRPVSRKVVRVLVENGAAEGAPTCVCGRPLFFRDVKGTVNRDKPCNAKCVESIGHVCECACGGRNHGAGFGS